MQKKSKKQELRVWFTKERGIDWKATNLSPSEMCLMAAVIQEAALVLTGECEISQDGKGTVTGKEV
jgi:hypothetical protein